MASPAVIEGDIPYPCRFEAVAEGGDGVITLLYSRKHDSGLISNTWRRRVNARTFERLLDILGADLASTAIGGTVVGEYDIERWGLYWHPPWHFKVFRESKTEFRMAIKPDSRLPKVPAMANTNQFWSMVMDHGDLSGFAEKAVECAACASRASDLTKGRIID